MTLPKIYTAEMDLRLQEILPRHTELRRAREQADQYFRVPLTEAETTELTTLETEVVSLGTLAEVQAKLDEVKPYVDLYSVVKAPAITCVKEVCSELADVFLDLVRDSTLYNDIVTISAPKMFAAMSTYEAAGFTRSEAFNLITNDIASIKQALSQIKFSQPKKD